MASSKDSRSPSRNYRKPPVAHQFQKGTSGNPKGRPKKKAAQPGFGALGGGIEDRLAIVALDEAIRPVTVREGDKVAKLPAMQALLRTLIRSGAQGDIKAARQVLELITRAETGRTASALEALQKAAQYKEYYGPIFEECERNGRPPPEIFPHPDDILIDANTGEVTLDGPLSKEAAGVRKAMREHALKSKARFLKLPTKLYKNPTDRALRRELKELKAVYAYVIRDNQRLNRHALLRLARRTHDSKPPQPPEDDSTGKAK